MGGGYDDGEDRGMEEKKVGSNGKEESCAGIEL